MNKGFLESENKRFEFVFQGTEDQFRFFFNIVKKTVQDADITFDNYTDDGFHCSISNNCGNAFKVGMIISACYRDFWN